MQPLITYRKPVREWASPEPGTPRVRRKVILGKEADRGHALALVLRGARW